MGDWDPFVKEVTDVISWMFWFGVAMTVLSFVLTVIVIAMLVR